MDICIYTYTYIHSICREEILESQTNNTAGYQYEIDRVSENKREIYRERDHKKEKT